MTAAALGPVPAGAVAATVLLAGAVLALGGRPGRDRLTAAVVGPAARPAVPARPLRLGWVAVGGLAFGAVAAVTAGPVAGVVTGGAAALVGGLLARRMASPARQDGQAVDLVGSWELIAVCLEAGLPVAVAVSAAADPLAGRTAAHLRRVSGLLELGADPAEAWAGTEHLPALATFARAAARSAGTGAALAQVARAEGARVRAELIDSAQARAQRAAVLITGPLGLCFLPAFLVLGIAPVVIGLAAEALAQW